MAQRHDYENFKDENRRTSNSDSKGRIVLGSKHANRTYRVQELPDGNILLEPIVMVHEREAWLYRNPEALAAVLEGIEQSKRGETVDLGSFAQYADDEIDD
jgi:hypothetical protein